MNKPYFKTVTVLTMAALILLPFFYSCSSHSEGASFTNELDVIDNCIASGDTKEALSLLNSVAKKAYSSYSRIGIYKRYMILGETQLAEKTLVKALKKIPKNPELTAVYTQFLLRQGRIDEALERSRTLSGTTYGSLYAEAVLRASENRGSDAASVFVPHKKYKAPKKTKKERLAEKEHPFSFADFLRTDPFIDVYTDAWLGTKQSLWLRNAATLRMRNGAYSEAVMLVPKDMENAEDSLFWGTVYYDAGRYGESLTSLLQAQNLSYYSDLALNTVPEEIAALEADDYYILGDEESSQKEREIVLQAAAPALEKYEADLRNPLVTPSFNKNLANIIPVVYLNNARYAYMNSDIVSEYTILRKTVDTFPEYVPGLAAYGQFALDTMRRPPEDAILQELRAAGLKTIQMEKNDALPKVTVDNAMTRINWVLKTKKVPGLVVLKEELHDAVDKETPSAERVAHIWELLEENLSDTDLYPPEIMKYAMVRLISLGAKEQAETFFFNYLQAEYKNAFKSPAEKPEMLSLWECEIAAWFAADDNNITDSQRLYEFIINKYADRIPLVNSTTENTSVISAYINLAVIRTSTGDDRAAYELLNSANGRTADPVLKSEILYRMAVLSVADGDTRSARRSLQDAVTLNPSFSKAYLMLKTLK